MSNTVSTLDHLTSTKHEIDFATLLLRILILTLVSLSQFIGQTKAHNSHNRLFTRVAGQEITASTVGVTRITQLVHSAFGASDSFPITVIKSILSMV